MLQSFPATPSTKVLSPKTPRSWISSRRRVKIFSPGIGHWPKGRGTWASPALLEKDLAFDIRGQDGRRFWGVTTLSGGGEKTDEPFIGELTGKDYRSFVFADTDGFWNGQLDGDDTLSFCYMHTHSRSTVVSCSQVKRTR
jgi:hypothetical protein